MLDHRYSPAPARRLFLFLAALLAMGCARPQQPIVTPHLVRVSAVSVRGLELEVELDVQNPNSFPLAVDAVSGTLFVAGDQKLAQGSASPHTTIAAGGTSRVRCSVHVDWSDLSALAPLLAYERVPYRFAADVSLGGERMHVTLPFTLSGELTRSQLIDAGFRGL